MTDTTDLIPRDDIPEDEDGLFAYLSQLVEQARRVASTQANATLTMRNWLMGHATNTNILHHTRADYGKQIVVTLSQQLTERFGIGFDKPNVSRMMKFAQQFPDYEIGDTVTPIELVSHSGHLAARVRTSQSFLH